MLGSESINKLQFLDNGVRLNRRRFCCLSSVVFPLVSSDNAIRYTLVAILVFILCCSVSHSCYFRVNREWRREEVRRRTT
jgi:hypothetical protein